MLIRQFIAGACVRQAEGRVSFARARQGALEREGGRPCSEADRRCREPRPARAGGEGEAAEGRTRGRSRPATRAPTAPCSDPTRPGSARSATSGPCTAPWRHSPTPNAAMTVASRTAAATPVTQTPANGTRSQQPAQRRPRSARIRIRRCPSDARVTGSWARTITTVFTKKITPIIVSVTRRLVLRVDGQAARSPTCPRR